MTAFSLQSDLRDELEKLLFDCQMKGQDGEKAHFQVFENSTPIPEDDNEPDFFPYVVVRTQSGEIPESKDTAPTVKVLILIGLFDDDLENNGNHYVLLVIQRIIERFKKNTLLSEKYNCTGNIEWTLSDEDSYPFFFGGLEMNFTIPSIEKESDYC
jgi:hypothetical protein